jgi:hypothetical protein
VGRDVVTEGELWKWAALRAWNPQYVRLPLATLNTKDFTTSLITKARPS